MFLAERSTSLCLPSARVAGVKFRRYAGPQGQTRDVTAHRSSENNMSFDRTIKVAVLLSVAASLSLVYTVGYAQSSASSAPTSKSGPAATTGPKEDASADRFSRGKKLVLKDGTFQLVRNYEQTGERVRYFSVERNAWEEIPSAMIDWSATEKARIEDEKKDEALVKRVQAQEQAKNVIAVLDVDASLPVAQGVFLPSGEGMFVVTGKTVTKLDQVGSQTRVDKKRALEQVISPVPIIPSKHNVEIPGARATIRVTPSSGPPEFYLREVAPDPDNPTAIWQSSRQGVSGPDVELVRATVKGNKRRIKTIRSMMGQQLSSDINTISIQRWEVAPSVYRFTISEPLPPGEYALAEILPDGMNVFVWDFGVEAAPPKH